MLINEFKKELESGKFSKDIIEIKQFLPSIEKKMLVDTIIEGCIEVDENNLMQINYFNKKLFEDLSLIVNYTNLELSDESINDYDFLVENGYARWIIEEIPDSEKEFIDNLLHYELEQKVEQNNSLTNVVAKALNKLVDKIPDEKSIKKMISNIPKSINKIKPENLNILKDFVNQQQLQQVKEKVD